MTIAYYIQTPSLSTTGVLQSKSLNTYEVTVTYEPGYNNTQYTKIAPTGVMYVVKDGKIVKKKTKAKLESAWPWGEPISNIGTDHYHKLFTTPDLALASKALSIQKQVQDFSDRLAKVNERIEEYKEIGDATKVFKQSNPEWFV